MLASRGYSDAAAAEWLNDKILEHLSLGGTMPHGGFFTGRQVRHWRSQYGIVKSGRSNGKRSLEAITLPLARAVWLRVQAARRGWGHLLPGVRDDEALRPGVALTPSMVRVLDALADAGRPLTTGELLGSIGLKRRPRTRYGGVMADVLCCLVSCGLVAREGRRRAGMAVYALAAGVSRHERSIMPDGIYNREQRREKAKLTIADDDSDDLDDLD